MAQKNSAIILSWVAFLIKTMEYTIIQKILASPKGTKFWVEYPYRNSFGYMVVAETYLKDGDTIVVFSSTNKKTPLHRLSVPINISDSDICPNDFLNSSIFPSKKQRNWDLYNRFNKQ